MLKLNKKQVSEAIYSLLTEKDGLNDVFKMTLEGLMKVERQEVVSGDCSNKCNGYRSKNSLGFGKGFKLSIPRDRLGVFQPYMLELLKEDENRIKDACFELYSKGLTTKDVGNIIEKLYGKSYSESSITNITKGFYGIMEQWRNRSLESNWAVIYIDAIFVKVRRDTVESEAFYVLLGLKDDMTREVLGIYNYPTERATNWVDIFKNLVDRGVQQINLMVSDGLTGIENALKQVFPKTPLQTCIVHYERNLMKEVRPKDKEEFGIDLREIFNPNRSDDTPEKAKIRLKEKAQKWQQIYPKLSKKMAYDADYKLILFEYMKYDYTVRPMIYTTNWIERLNKSFRKTLKVRGSLPSVESALVLLTKVAIDVENSTYSYKISNFKNEPKLFIFENTKNKSTFATPKNETTAIMCTEVL
jgi:transposase-like protein